MGRYISRRCDSVAPKRFQKVDDERVWARGGKRPALAENYSVELSCCKGISRAAERGCHSRHFTLAWKLDVKNMDSRLHRSLRASLASQWLVLLFLLWPTVLNAQEGTNQSALMPNSALPVPDVRSRKQDDTGRLAPPTQPVTRMIIEMTTGETHLNAINPSV